MHIRGEFNRLTFTIPKHQLVFSAQKPTIKSFFLLRFFSKSVIWCAFLCLFVFICIYFPYFTKKHTFFCRFFLLFFPQQNDSSLLLPAFFRPSRPHNSRFPDPPTLLARLGTHLFCFSPKFCYPAIFQLSFLVRFVKNILKTIVLVDTANISGKYPGKSPNKSPAYVARRFRLIAAVKVAVRRCPHSALFRVSQ